MKILALLILLKNKLSEVDSEAQIFQNTYGKCNTTNMGKEKLLQYLTKKGIKMTKETSHNMSKRKMFKVSKDGLLNSSISNSTNKENQHLK